MNNIYIYKSKKKIKIFPQVQTKEGFKIMYKPVFIITDLFNLEKIEKAIFQSFQSSKESVNIGDFPSNSIDYRNYMNDLLIELEEKSLTIFQKKYNQFKINLSDDENVITIYPLKYKSSGSIIVKEKVKKIETLNKTRKKIALEILDIVSDING